MSPKEESAVTAEAFAALKEEVEILEGEVQGLTERVAALEAKPAAGGWKDATVPGKKAKLRPVAPAEKHKVEAGDIFIHYAESEFYIVIGFDGSECRYASSTSYSEQKLMDASFAELRDQQKTMSTKNANGLVAEGTWKFVRNVKSNWG